MRKLLPLSLVLVVALTGCGLYGVAQDARPLGAGHMRSSIYVTMPGYLSRDARDSARIHNEDLLLGSFGADLQFGMTDNLDLGVNFTGTSLGTNVKLARDRLLGGWAGAAILGVNYLFNEVTFAPRAALLASHDIGPYGTFYFGAQAFYADRLSIPDVWPEQEKMNYLGSQALAGLAIRSDYIRDHYPILPSGLFIELGVPLFVKYPALTFGVGLSGFTFDVNPPARSGSEP